MALWPRNRANVLGFIGSAVPIDNKTWRLDKQTSSLALNTAAVPRKTISKPKGKGRLLTAKSAVNRALRGGTMRHEIAFLVAVSRCATHQCSIDLITLRISIERRMRWAIPPPLIVGPCVSIGGIAVEPA